jgi:hypothetical protein
VVDPRDDGTRLPASVIGMVVDGLRRVEESVTRLSTDMHDQLSRLPDIYVPRREVERRFDEHTIDLGEIRAHTAAKQMQHDADMQRLDAAIQAVEERRRADRKWLFGAVSTVIGLLLTVITIVLQLN